MTTIELFRKSLTVMLAVVTCTSFIVTPGIAGPPKRGDYPQCQEVCLNILKKRMNEISETYKKSGDKLLYQEQVEVTRLDYDRCIDDCREVFPVK